MQDLYSQLVCPAIFFTTEDPANVGVTHEQEIVPTQNKDGTLSFDFDLVADICYIGIKVTTSTGE